MKFVVILSISLLGSLTLFSQLANVASTNPTPTEITYVGGVTSAIQTQLGAKAPIASPSFTGTAVIPLLSASDMLFGGQSVTRATLTHAGTVTLDCSITNRYATLTLTGNVTFATASLTAGKWYNVVITMTSTNDTPTFPAWLWLGGAPSTLTGGKVGWLSIYPQSTTDATTLAAYAETQ